MATPANNLLFRLHRWAWRQDENFLTEAFAHLLTHLVEHEPEVGVRLANKVTGNLLAFDSKVDERVEVRTQVRGIDGKPDIEILSGKQKLAIRDGTRQIRLPAFPGTIRQELRFLCLEQG